MYKFTGMELNLLDIGNLLLKRFDNLNSPNTIQQSTKLTNHYKLYLYSVLFF